MTTDPSKSLPLASVSDSAKTEIDRLMQAGIADFSLRELLGMLISSTGSAERNLYLEKNPVDKSNGFYDRSLQMGTIPVEVRVPRTRNGDFRPECLPAPYRRGYGEEVQSLLTGLLGSSRSINSAKDALHKMGLSHSDQDLERVAADLIQELELRNSRPVDPDMIAVFVDGKYVELREGDKLRSACIYLAVGLDLRGNKQVLSCVAKPGRENLEDWKSILRGLIERGLRRVMIFIQDDFSGLLPITQGFFRKRPVKTVC
jgi:putative transposase